VTEDPTRPVPLDPDRPVDPPRWPPVDPTRTQPVDPWIGSAPVAPPPDGPTDPVIVYVERPRRRRWPWIVGGLAVLALMCCLGAVAIWTPISREYPASLELGDTAAGFERVRDPEVDRLTAELVVQMFREYGVDDGLAAMLTDPATPERRVILLAATKLFLDPGKELDQAIRGVTDRPIRNVTDYERLGANLTCADTEDEQSQAVIVCAWVDHGSVGLGIFYGAWTMDDAAVALRDLRAAVVRRG
jgi:hypothetical protein